MTTRKGIPSGQAWIDQIFTSEAARNKGIVRRNLDWVKVCASLALLEAEVNKRGFHMVLSGDQCVIFCNDGYFKMVA